MNYNDYDSNGNKKRFNFSDILNDRTQRSRFFLFVYLVIFIILVILIRINLSNTTTNNKGSNKESNTEINDNKNIESKDSTEIDEMFSFIDMNNYIFNYEVNINDSISLIDGQRYNDKYSFKINNDGNILYFNGTSNYIRAKEENSDYKLTGFPYVLVNYFDTKLLKNIISSASINNDKYEITNEKIGSIVKYDLDNKSSINTIELVKRNNKITQIKLNISNAVSAYMNDSIKANITLKFGNFGLVDDFRIE